MALNNLLGLGLEKFSQALKRFGFFQSNGYHSLFYKHSKDEEINILVIYVDGIIIIGSDFKDKMKIRKRTYEEICGKKPRTNEAFHRNRSFPLVKWNHLIPTKIYF